MQSLNRDLGSVDVPVAGGVAKAWPMTTLPRVDRDGRITHADTFILHHIITIVSAIGAAAIKGEDLIRLIAGITFRRGGVEVMPGIDGARNRVFNAAMSGGEDPDPLPPDVPAGGAGGNTVTVEWYERIRFRFPMLSDPDLLVWPVSSFDERGTLQIQSANIGTELGAGYSITAWTCQCLVDMSGYEEARVGLDVRRKIASVTGNNGGQVQTEQGYYLAALVATPPAAGTMGAASGMADHSLVAAIDCGDVLKVSHPTLTGPDYCEAHESRSDLTGPARITDGSAGALPMSRNLYQQRACVPLIAPARRAGKVTYSVVRLSAQPKFTSVIGGGGFPNGTHILHAMVQPHEKSELDYIASRSGIADSSGRYSISNRTQNGRKPHVESLPILPVMLSPPKAGGKTVNRAVKARGQ